MTGPTKLPPSVAHALQQKFNDVTVLVDHSWGDTSTKVLEVEADGQRSIVKTFGPENHHFERELLAHREFLDPLRGREAVPDLVHVDEDARLLVTAYLPGTLVEKDDAEWDPDAYRQAGQLLALLHGQASRSSNDYVGKMLAKMRRDLAEEHRIEPQVQLRVEQVASGVEASPVVLMPCHGDFQPRNWLIHEGQVALIDFGRAAWRIPQTDLVRLAAQQFRGHPELEEAFFYGYGSDPRLDDWWGLAYLEEAVGTAAYAYRIGDEAFEAQGHRMITEALQLFDA